MQTKRINPVAQLPAATSARNFRTFLLMQQFEAREIGARIRQARLERGLTQEELAALTSFSKRSLQDYESGETIPYRHIGELSRILGRPQEWFLYGDETVSVGEERIREIFREEIEAALSRLLG
jgi:transcriptional regulator with XRE-family HTH domain